MVPLSTVISQMSTNRPHENSSRSSKSLLRVYFDTCKHCKLKPGTEDGTIGTARRGVEKEKLRRKERKIRKKEEKPTLHPSLMMSDHLNIVCNVALFASFSVTLTVKVFMGIEPTTSARSKPTLRFGCSWNLPWEAAYHSLLHEFKDSCAVFEKKIKFWVKAVLGSNNIGGNREGGNWLCSPLEFADRGKLYLMGFRLLK